MFFLVRSAVCVGIVFCMLPNSGGGKSLQDLATDTGRLAVNKAETYCAASADCAQAGVRLAAAAFTKAAAPADAADRRRVAQASPAASDIALHSARTKIPPRI